MVITRELKEEMQQCVTHSILKALEDKKVIDRIVSAVTSTFHDQLKQIETAFSSVINTLQEDNNKLKMEIEQVKTENSQLKDAVDMITMKYEQDKKRNNIILHGLTEQDNENLESVVNDLILNKLKNVVYPIKEVYRMGKSHRNGSMISRPVLIKFQSALERDLTMKRRSLLKGSQVFMTDDLAQYVLHMFKTAREIYGKNNVWTVGGFLKIKWKGEIYKINNMKDFPKK